MVSLSPSYRSPVLKHKGHLCYVIDKGIHKYIFIYNDKVKDKVAGIATKSAMNTSRLSLDPKHYITLHDASRLEYKVNRGLCTSSFEGIFGGKKSLSRF